jgi:hypothetical protein
MWTSTGSDLAADSRCVSQHTISSEQCEQNFAIVRKILLHTQPSHTMGMLTFCGSKLHTNGTGNEHFQKWML